MGSRATERHEPLFIESESHYGIMERTSTALTVGEQVLTLDPRPRGRVTIEL